ncbi:MAG TPA: BON domain-containing protein, partial [Blastocatellia bacterium]|nr:BON domain-containing protein [Blastocatellia bacterium]
HDRLTDYPYLDASDIEVIVENAEVTLTGVVDSRQAKRMAEEIAEEVSGVSNVENRLRVRQSRWNTALASQETATTSITDTAQTDTGTEAAAKTTGAGTSGRRSS